jgi:hypothetical protein
MRNAMFKVLQISPPFEHCVSMRHVLIQQFYVDPYVGQRSYAKRNVQTQAKFAVKYRSTLVNCACAGEWNARADLVD